MRVRHLEALEGNRFDELPGRAYARAFLRSYATALELDADRFVAEFDEQVPEPEESWELAPPPPRRRGIPLKTAPIAAVVSLAVLLVWAAWSNDHLGSRDAAAPPPAQSADAAAVVHHVARVKAAVAAVHSSPRLVVRAVRGPCWVQVRRGGPTGKVIAERTLPAGSALRLSGQHLWLRLGAPWNVRVQRGSHVVTTPSGSRPVDLVA